MEQRYGDPGCSLHSRGLARDGRGCCELEWSELRTADILPLLPPPPPPPYLPTSLSLLVLFKAEEVGTKDSSCCGFKGRGVERF